MRNNGTNHTPIAGVKTQKQTNKNFVINLTNEGEELFFKTLKKLRKTLEYGKTVC